MSPPHCRPAKRGRSSVQQKIRHRTEADGLDSLGDGIAVVSGMDDEAACRLQVLPRVVKALAGFRGQAPFDLDGPEAELARQLE